MSKTIAVIIIFVLLCYSIIYFMGYFQNFLLSGQDEINRPMVTAVSDINNNHTTK